MNGIRERTEYDTQLIQLFFECRGHRHTVKYRIYSNACQPFLFAKRYAKFIIGLQ